MLSNKNDRYSNTFIVIDGLMDAIGSHMLLVAVVCSHTEACAVAPQFCSGKTNLC